MPVSYDTADAPVFVRYTFAGDWAAREIVERRRELVRAGQLTPKTAVLFDLRTATNLPDLADLHPALQSSTTDGIWPVCRAFIVNTQAQYNCARQLQALLDPQSVVNEIFYEESTAMQWLAAMSSQTKAIRA